MYIYVYIYIYVNKDTSTYAPTDATCLVCTPLDRSRGGQIYSGPGARSTCRCPAQLACLLQYLVASLELSSIA